MVEKLHAANTLLDVQLLRVSRWLRLHQSVGQVQPAREALADLGTRDAAGLPGKIFPGTVFQFRGHIGPQSFFESAHQDLVHYVRLQTVSKVAQTLYCQWQEGSRRS